MMKMLKACYDWRVITGLVAIGVALFVLSPGLLAAGFPLLLVAVCPLSMALMMRSMGSHQPAAGPDAAPASADQLRERLAASRREQQALLRELDDLESDPSIPSATASPASAPH